MNTYVKISAIAVTTLIGSFIGFQKSNTEINTTQYETVIFATVLSSDELSSVEEKETAFKQKYFTSMGYFRRRLFYLLLRKIKSSHKFSHAYELSKMFKTNKTLCQQRDS